jgi:hypothetical protein
MLRRTSDWLKRSPFFDRVFWATGHHPPERSLTAAGTLMRAGYFVGDTGRAPD